MKQLATKWLKWPALGYNLSLKMAVGIGLLAGTLALSASSLGQRLKAWMLEDTLITASVCAGESYDFNGELLNESGTYTTVLTAADGSDSTVVLELTVLEVPSTQLSATICEGSSYVFQGETLTEAGTYADTLLAENGCDSVVTLSLSTVEFFETALTAAICPGDTFLFHADTLVDAGIYTDTLTAVGGCDSIVTLNLRFLPVPSTLLTATLCTGTFYVFQGDTLRDAGIYRDTLVAANGCDSLLSLRLSFVDFFATELAESICEGDTFVFGGDELSASGTYTDTLTAVGGCDSILVLNLEVIPPVLNPLSAAICPGDTLLFENDTLTTAGDYVYTYPAANGCDSIISLSLEILPVSETNLTASLCQGDSLLFDGAFITEGGLYEAVYTGANGCDSVVTLDLTILSNPLTSLSVSICDGDEYEFDGQILTEAGAYSALYPAANGCDSLVNLELTVLPNAATSIAEQICSGQTYDFNGASLSESGTYEAVLVAANGCDSIVTLELTVLPNAATSLEVSICADQIYDFNGQLINETGVYESVLPAANGCDSIVTLNLTVLPDLETLLEVSICEGDSYDFNGQLLTEAGDYQTVVVSSAGCDSSLFLSLSILPNPLTLLTVTICDGESYEFDGQLLTQGGAYSALYPAANGCDSLVTLELTVLDNPLTLLTVSICEGSSYEFDGQVLTEGGAYSALYPSANGCDSLVTLELIVEPNPMTLLPVTICDGDGYEFDGQTLTADGAYSALYTSAAGCDSLVTLLLTVLPNPLTLLTESICAGDSYAFDGQELTEAGAYSALYTSVNGCDSLVALELSVLSGDTTDLSEVICAGESIPFYGAVLSESGQYEAVLPAANGCDSLLRLTLTVLPTYNTTLNESICEGYSFSYNGEELFEAGVYEYAFTAANGCDSTVTLNLEVLPLVNSLYLIQQCVGTSYFFDGQDLTESGIYTSLGIAANGCDSLAILELTFVTEFVTPSTASICAGESYDFQGQSLTEGGLYTDTLTAVGGCDSILLLQLSVLPTSSTELSQSVCAGTSVPFNGQVLTEAGIYTATLTNAAGCDSLVTLNLSVIAPVTSSLTATICQDEGYPFNGALLTESGEYTANLVAASGCDSVVTLQLTVIPTTFTTLSETICAGESVVYQGESLSESGTYQFVLSSSQGCDSVVTFILNVLPVAQSNVAITTCDDVVFFNGEGFNVSGVYTFVLPGEAASGCDSAIVLNLTFLEEPPTTFISANICSGETYEFNGVSLSDSGEYLAVRQAANGCDSTIVLNLTVTTVNTEVTQNGNTLQAVATDATYQWVNCNGNVPIPGATASSFTPTTTGLYAVVVTQNGCSAQSTCTEVVIVSTTQILPGEAQWQLLPNPAKDHSTLVFESATTTEFDLSIYDATGRLLSRRRLASATERVDLDLSGMPDGMLFVRLAHQSEVSTKRLLKTGN